MVKADDDTSFVVGTRVQFPHDDLVLYSCDFFISKSDSGSMNLSLDHWLRKTFLPATGTGIVRVLILSFNIKLNPEWSQLCQIPGRCGIFKVTVIEWLKADDNTVCLVSSRVQVPHGEFVFLISGHFLK